MLMVPYGIKTVLRLAIPIVVPLARLVRKMAPL
jgi:hypothetical protein